MNERHYVCYNMTAAEEFRLNGTLCTPTIERLIDKELDLSESAISDAVVYIEEAKSCYPGEDFLRTTIGSIRTIANRLRGQNKVELLELVSKLQGIESEVVRESEYGSDELRKALQGLKRVNL